MNQIEYGQEYPKNNREHKSTVFCKVFADKKDLMNLYNALNGTDYKDINYNTKMHIYSKIKMYSFSSN